MEETLGKRIVANRKRLGLTQDALAEKLGVTAQAVSKWENDQSCPDITMLPKLAQIFGITTDALLGLKQEEVHPAEIVTAEAENDDEPEGFHFHQGNWEVKLDGGRRGSAGIGIWILLVGALMLLGRVVGVSTGFLDLLWPTGLLVFGLFGLYPRFSILRLGCVLLGAGLLLDLLELIPFSWNLEMLLPIFLLLAGVHLVAKAFRHPGNGSFHITHNGKDVGKANFTIDGEHFDCICSFGENRRHISMPRLSSGHVQNSFGETRLDFGGCEEFARNCAIDASCSFGELELRFPRSCRVVPDIRTAFASLAVDGQPDADAVAEVYVNGSVSFGELTIRYI